jgi:hypothetical protein
MSQNLKRVFRKRKVPEAGDSAEDKLQQNNFQ